MLVDFAGLSVLSEQPSQHSLSPHPLNLGGHTGLSSTLSFTGAGVTTLSLCGKKVACAGS